MQLKEALFRETLNGLRHRAARYRRFSSLLGGGNHDGRLTALADEIESWVEQMERSVDRIQTQAVATHLLVAEIEAHLAPAGERAAALAKFPLASRHSAEDLREEARLCAEEARAASSPSARRELAAKIAELADAAETIDRAEA
jgi:hypothetical protein